MVDDPSSPAVTPGLPGSAVTTSIVIPTWRRAEWLDKCLAGLSDQYFAPNDVIVVGRGVDKTARQVVERWRGQLRFPVSWVEVDRPGHIAPVERGLERARGEIVGFLDDDSEPQAGWLAALLEPFGDPAVGCVGGHVVTPDFRGVVHADAGQIRWYGKHIGNVGALETGGTVEVNGVMECNWAWRRELLSALRFDRRLDVHAAPMYGLDLCLQAAHLGYKTVYQPRAQVIHHLAPRDPALDRADVFRLAHGYSRNYTIIGLKHFGGMRRIAFLAWWWLIGERASYGLATALVDLLLGRKVWTRVVTSFAGKRDGIRVWRRGLR